MNRALTLAEWFRARGWFLGLLVLTGLLLESAVFPHLTLFGAKPDLVMAVVACWGLLYGPQAGFVAGVGAGLLQDLLFMQYIGLFALAKGLVGLLIGVVESKIFKESIWVSTGAIGTAVLAHEFIIWFVLRRLDIPASGLALVTVALPTAFYTMLLAPVIYRRVLVHRAAEWIREREAAGGAGASGAR